MGLTGLTPLILLLSSDSSLATPRELRIRESTGLAQPVARIPELLMTSLVKTLMLLSLATLLRPISTDAGEGEYAEVVRNSRRMATPIPCFS